MHQTMQIPEKMNCSSIFLKNYCMYTANLITVSQKNAY